MTMNNYMRRTPMATNDILFAATDSGDLTLVKSILSEKNYLVDDRDDFGCTPLQIAAQKNHRDVAVYLLDSGADVNARNKDGYTALHFVTSKEMAELLIARGADVNIPDNYGLIPIHNAVLEGYHDIVECLILNGADINYVENKGFTPLKMAVQYQLPDIAELLRRHGAHE
jgi:ankyrin repeat protein